MASKHPGKDQARWKGAAVEAEPGDSAERAADRVAGNEPVRAEEEAGRLTDPDQPPTEGGGYRATAPAGGDGDEKIADAAEEHRDLQAGRSPRGKL
jgi:hypothetical protein